MFHEINYKSPSVSFNIIGQIKMSYKCDTEHNCAFHSNHVILMKYNKMIILMTSSALHRWQNTVAPDLLLALWWLCFHLHFSEDVDCFQTNNYIEYFKFNVDDEDYNYNIRKLEDNKLISGCMWTCGPCGITIYGNFEDTKLISRYM